MRNRSANQSVFLMGLLLLAKTKAKAAVRRAAGSLRAFFDLAVAVARQHGRHAAKVAAAVSAMFAVCVGCGHVGLASIEANLFNPNPSLLSRASATLFPVSFSYLGGLRPEKTPLGRTASFGVFCANPDAAAEFRLRLLARLAEKPKQGEEVPTGQALVDRAPLYVACQSPRIGLLNTSQELSFAEETLKLNGIALFSYDANTPYFKLGEQSPQAIADLMANPSSPKSQAFMERLAHADDEDLTNRRLASLMMATAPRLAANPLGMAREGGFSMLFALGLGPVVVAFLALVALALGFESLIAVHRFISPKTQALRDSALAMGQEALAQKEARILAAAASESAQSAAALRAQNGETLPDDQTPRGAKRL